MTDRRYEETLPGVMLDEMPALMGNAIRAVRKQMPDGTVVAVFVFSGGAVSYIANGERDDIVAALEEWCRRQHSTAN